MAARFRLLLACVALHVGLPSPPASASNSRPARTWLAVSTPKFHIFTTASPEAAQALALELEHFRATIGAFTGVNVDALPPVTVVLFGSEREFDPFRPLQAGRPAPIAGYFARGTWLQIIGLGTGRLSEARRIVFHEAAHWAMQDTPIALPLWLSEGAAEVFSTFRVREGRISIGDPPPNHVRLLRRIGLRPTSELLARPRDQLQFHNRGQTAQFYAQAWLMTHYLWRANDGDSVSRLLHYVHRLAQGEGSPQAFERAFDLSPAGMDRELTRYLLRRRLPRERILLDGARPESALPVRTADLAEINRALGELALAADRPSDAEPILRAAVLAEPTDPRAHELLGASLYFQGREPEARWSLQRALDYGSTRTDTRLVVGSLWMQAAYELTDSIARQQQLRRAADLYLITLADDPEALGALHGIAALAGGLDPTAPEDEAALRDGTRRFPRDRRIPLGLALLALRRDDVATAQALITRVLDSPGAVTTLPVDLAATSRPCETHDLEKQRAAAKLAASVTASTPEARAARPGASSREQTRWWRLAVGLQRVEVALATAATGDLERAAHGLDSLQRDPRQPEEVRQRAAVALRSLPRPAARHE